MNRKTYRIPLKEMTISDEGKGSIVFATMGVIDKDGDITDKGAFGTGQVAHLLPMHVWKSADTPFLGVATIREEGDKAIADIEINMDIQRAKDWRSSLKFALEHGKDIEWSYGFDIEDRDSRKVDGRNVRGLKKLKVHEVSPVVIGAGEGTGTLSMKDYVGLTGTWEAAQEAIRVAVSRLLLGDQEGWVSLLGTTSSTALVCVYTYYDNSHESRHYQFDWTMEGDVVSLSGQQEVDLQTVVVAKNLKLADGFARVLGEVKSLIDRSKALAAGRAKEGRTLSRVNRERLTRLQSELTALLAETEPATAAETETESAPAADGKSTNLDGLYAEFMELESQLAGNLA